MARKKKAVKKKLRKPAPAKQSKVAVKKRKPPVKKKVVKRLRTFDPNAYSVDENYKTLFNLVEDCICIFSPEGTFIDVNDGVLKIYGYKKKELISKTPELLLVNPGHDLPAFNARIKKSFAGTPQVMETWCRTKEGQTFLKDLHFRRGSYFGSEIVIVIGRDITSRKRIEVELKESEERYRTLLQASFGGIGMHDKGIIIDCNQGLCDITGYSRDELIGSDGLNLVAPEWRPLVMDKILSGYEKPYDVEGLHKSGSKYFLEVQAKSIPYRGKIIRVTEFRNINDRKRSEEKIKEQNLRLRSLTEDLQRKNDQLEEFTQIVSHNLRSPVGNILTLLSFLESSSNEKETAEYVHLLKESGLTAQRTLQELHEVLKIKQNKKIARQKLKFENAFQHATRMLSARISEVSAHIEGDFNLAPEIVYPNIYLESIFLNLLSNSLKYNHPDRTPVILFKTYLDKDGHVVLEVSDNGLGINLSRYGHQIFKLHKTFHRHPESRGIGLFMIKNQIEALGGEISIRSEENTGTTIIINFNTNQSDESTGTDNSGNR